MIYTTKTLLSLIPVNLNQTNFTENEYEEDYELDLLHLSENWFIRFIPAIVIYSLTFLLGFFGNILVIFSILYLKKLQSITNLFLLSLATADLLLIIICVPIKVNLILFVQVYFILDLSETNFYFII